MARPKDVRLMVVYGYARLMKFDRNLNLAVDILKNVEVKSGRIFTLHIRPQHKWSDGAPFTAEDFRYHWEDVANNRDLSPNGPPDIFRVAGELPRFEVIDETTVRYSWSKPNPIFLTSFAKTRPAFIYRPAHYLKQFHARYRAPEKLNIIAKKLGLRSWAGLHNKIDNPYKNDNPDLPTLQPWMNTTKLPAEQFNFQRNPYYHKVDRVGRQLPYIDRVVMRIADGKIIPAKAGAGESDLQARYIRFDNYAFLKQNEDRFGFNVFLWKIGKGAHLALYPNLNFNDPTWRRLLRDVQFRRTLSLAINRRELNRVLFFGLGLESQNTVLPGSSLFSSDYQTAWTRFDIQQANKILDEIGLTKRNERGIRLMPDGRPLEIIVESAGESTEESDVLRLIHDSWLKVGIKLYEKSSHRDIMRSRIFAGDAMMVISSGLENGLPTPDSSPDELAPTKQIQYQWPKWGQFVESNGQTGEFADVREAILLNRLLEKWYVAPTRDARAVIWREMLSIHADQLFSIGLISGTLQPVIANKNLRNVPKKAIYNWDPGAHFGLYEPDTFWFEPRN
jgi:peptide/nickel transport system substrate-binding protein